MENELLQGARPRVFVSNPDDPEDGSTFVCARARWYERLEGELGNVAFAPIADTDEELNERLAQEGLPDLTELDDDYAQRIAQEFLNQSPLYPEAAELSDQEPSQEG